MKQRIMASILVFLLVFSLVPLIGAKGVGEVEAEPAAFGGTLNNSTDLLFDFSNNDAAVTRYKGAAYGGYNFDKETNGYWATGYNTNKTNYSISNANGTLRVKVTDGADASGTYGPWIKVTNTYGTLPSYNEASHPYYPLSFNPKNVKFVTIKFKLSGCSVPSGQVPKVVFEYYFTKGGTYSYGNDMAASFTAQDGYYQTVTIPVSSKLKGADVLKGFGFRFRNVRGTNGTIYIDYIYMGASGSMELPSHGDRTVLSQSVNPILSGVNESQIYLKDKSDSAQMAGYMATVAPSAKVTFKASYPGYYTKGSTVASRKTAAPNLPFKGATTTAQAAAYETATGETVYLAINADFFNMDTYHTRGQLALEGNVIQTYGTRATPFFAVLKDGSYAIRPFGAPMGDVQEAVGGYHWLVRGGSLVVNEDVRHPRTAIGLKKDGTVVIFAVDGRQEPYSAGMTLEELAELMLAAGCVDAINLDGGGSTTFATRYNNGASDLIIRNKPCDNTGERTVTSTLLLVAQNCKHTYNRDYTVHDNGTHSVSCASCGNRITASHSYTKGVCLCGDRAYTGKGLYFGFGNSSFDQYRYTDPAYGSCNFDATDNGKWNRGHWYTGYTGTNQDYTIDHSTGTLTVKVTDGYSGSAAEGNLSYGPWLKLTYGDGVGPTKTNGTFALLNYAPKNVEEVRLRFKLTGCQIPSGTTPKVYFEYYYTKDGAYAGATDMSATYTFTEGEYLTVTMPASATLKSADVLKGFGLRFQNIKSTSGGKLTLDYIYIGEKASDTLLFHFDNSTAAKERYRDPAYGFVNFDTATKGYWATYYNGANTAFTVNNGEGTLNVTVTEGYSGSAEGGNIIYGPWVKTTNTYGKFTGKTTYDYYPLSYDPTNAEYFQIRFKTTGCETDAEKTPRVVLEYYYTKDGVYGYATDVVGSYSLKNGEYQTVTIPLTENFKTAGEILCFGIRFQHIKSTNGSVNIDYIAIGSGDGIPNPRYTVTFKNGDGKVLATQSLYKGETATYTGATPTKEPDATGHYTFSGWNKALTNITADTVFTAQFTSASHSYTYSKVDDGNHKGTCSCGYTITASHAWDSGRVTAEPTCNGTGVKTYTCTVCKGTKTESIAPTGHKETVDKAVAPTCTATGLTEGKHCSVCNAVLVAQEVVPAKGHSYTYTTLDLQNHTVGCARCNLKETAPHSYENGSCICGEAESKEPIEDASLKLNHSLNLASDISVNLVVPKTLLEGFDMATVYVESTLETYDGNEKTGTQTLRVEPVDRGYFYYFTLDGLTAVQMNDRITSVLYGTKNGQIYYSPADEYSIATYAYTQLNKSGIADTLKTLCADLLRYGSKAQIFKAYRTDSLADRDMTEAQRAYLSDIETVTFGNTNRVLDDLPDAPITWAGKSLNLESKVALKFVFNMGAYEGNLSELSLRIAYTDAYGNEKTELITGPEPYGQGTGAYVFTVDTLLAAELRTVVSVQIFDGEIPVSATLQYSPDTYGNNKTGALLELCKALFAYSDSAKAYFA